MAYKRINSLQPWLSRTLTETEVNIRKYFVSHEERLLTMHYSTYSSQCATDRTAHHVFIRKPWPFLWAKQKAGDRVILSVLCVSQWEAVSATPMLSPPTALIRLVGKYMFHITLPGSFSIPTSTSLSAEPLCKLSSLRRPRFSHYTWNKQWSCNKQRRY